MFRSILILLILLFPAPALASDGDRSRSPQLIVQGDAVLEVPADQVQFSVGVTSEADDANVAMELNSKALLRVEKALIHAGLNKGEYSTGQFQLRPQWSARPRTAPPEWRPEIVGYAVQNSLEIKTGRLEQVGAMIGAANKAGANDIGQLRFSVADPRKYRQQAIVSATANARADAESAASAAGVKLGAVQRISLGQSAVTPIRPMAMDGMVRTMAAEAAPPIIAPDDLQVRASVTLVFLLD